MAEQPPVLRFQGSVNRRSGRRRFALQVDTLFDQRVTCVSGPSGSGKTALLRVLAGLEQPTGVLQWDGSPDRGPSPRKELLGTGMFLGADGSTSFYLDATIHCQLADLLDCRPDLDRFASMLNRFDLEMRPETRPRMLSGGQLQRLSYVFAIMKHPRMLLIDEPCSAVEHRVRRRYLQTLLESLKDRMIVYASHDQSLQIVSDRRLRITLMAERPYETVNTLVEE